MFLWKDLISESSVLEIFFKKKPMNPAERRIIHARLQDNENVVTFSEGNDPYRHVVIQLNK